MDQQPKIDAHTSLPTICKDRILIRYDRLVAMNWRVSSLQAPNHPRRLPQMLLNFSCRGRTARPAGAVRPAARSQFLMSRCSATCETCPWPENAGQPTESARGTSVSLLGTKIVSGGSALSESRTALHREEISSFASDVCVGDNRG